ncbi:MAG: phosphoglucosamine mutase [Bacteroidales bacterium]|nr:phosphoglucosamine mutase [Bacteroidales bacterium]
MSLIKSISGIRGTIGGEPGENLTPIDIVKFTYAYCAKLRERIPKPEGERYKVVVGKDGRISGGMVEDLVVGSLVACGVDVVKAGFASTPTTEMAVRFSKADGGIILTASHNPRQWNALKLLNEKGEFLTAAEGQAVLDCADSEDFHFAGVDCLGHVSEHDFTDEHIQAVLDLKDVDEQSIRDAGLTVVLDPVNSVGALIMPKLLERLGVNCITINQEVTGEFAHNPEPLPRNLTELSETVIQYHADLGISVDPDVDRLAFICEDGTPFVEENTLVAVADYLFERAAKVAETQGISLEEATAPFAPVSVSNLSSSRSLRDVTERWGGKYFASAVGEVNVTTLIHEKNALIGGEGNGGVIFPAIHAGRDAMVGVGLFLSYVAAKKMKVSDIKASLPQYSIVKNRIDLSDSALIDKILSAVKERYSSEKVNTIDGVKVDFEESRSWVHLRRSNTEPIIRIYSEAPTEDAAQALADEVIAIAAKVIG